MGLNNPHKSLPWAQRSISMPRNTLFLVMKSEALSWSACELACLNVIIYLEFVKCFAGGDWKQR